MTYKTAEPCGRRAQTCAPWLLGRRLQLCCRKGMRHYPAYCTDCKRLWLVATESAPSASPTCPRCDDRGRLVPGAYYSDPGSAVFMRLEAAIHDAQLSLAALGRLAIE